MLTNYLVNTTVPPAAPVYKDLALIFKPYVSGAYAATTGFKLANGNDLNQYFAPFTNVKGPITNMVAINTQDLNESFEYILYSCTGTFFESSNGTYSGVVFYIPFGSTPGQMTGSITFNRNITANIIVVGGGAGGGTYYKTTGYNWGGCGGGGGATIVVPSLSLVGDTTYSLAVGQGGQGGGTSTTTTIQSGGNDSSFTYTSTNIYTAGGGTVSAINTTGFRNSSGGNASISGSGPIGVTAWGGGGGGGEVNLSIADPQYGTGGTGGSYNGTNPGVSGNNAFYLIRQNGYALLGGSGGSSNSTTVYTPFNSITNTIVGGGGSAISTYTDNSNTGFYQGYAGLGTGGAASTSIDNTQQGWAGNANNNSYTQYTVSSGNKTTPGPTGLAGGYGAGGAASVQAVYIGQQNGCTAGVGGNGVVMIYWNNNS